MSQRGWGREGRGATPSSCPGNGGGGGGSTDKGKPGQAAQERAQGESNRRKKRGG